jgi:hypothetical protein
LFWTNNANVYLGQREDENVLEITRETKQRERSDRETTESPKLDEETARSNIEPKPI